ncbi:hypothetical protein PBN151_6103 [Paenibacillus sp. NAIST15-1]|nr:hypothetical protein PBN151_6103 [Paenibacillus sp. NAIST15-1]
MITASPPAHKNLRGENLIELGNDGSIKQKCPNTTAIAAKPLIESNSFILLLINCSPNKP